MDTDFWAAVAAISQAATVLVAIGAAFYARGQVREARQTRERVAQPEVVAFIDHNPTNWHYLDLVVKNFGQTAAYGITLTVPAPDVSPYHNNITGEDMGVTRLHVPKHIAVLAPGQEWRTIWDSAVKRKEHSDVLSDNDMVGTATFWDRMNHDPSHRPPFATPIWIDPKMFRGMLRISSVEPAKLISDKIGEVTTALNGAKNPTGGLWVYTVPGVEEHERRAKEQEELKAEFMDLQDKVERAQGRGTVQGVETDPATTNDKHVES